MPAKKASVWRGDELIAKIEAAAREAVNETVDATRDDARATHSWIVDPKPRKLKSGRRVNTHLERQIRSEHADRADANPSGAVGYTQRSGFVGLFHEEGTVHEHEFPTIRPAVDRQFPLFAERLRRRLK